MVTMPALLLDLYEVSGGHSCEVLARGLRGNTSDACQFGCSECSSVHQSMQHSGARWVTSERSYFCKSGVACHTGTRGFDGISLRHSSFRMLRSSPKHF